MFAKIIGRMAIKACLAAVVVGAGFAVSGLVQNYRSKKREQDKDALDAYEHYMAHGESV